MEARTDEREDAERGRVNTREVDADVRAERRRESRKVAARGPAAEGNGETSMVNGEDEA